MILRLYSIILPAPNYITKNVITEDVIFINSYRDIPNIDNKIVVIENADPGFDWIFTKNPKGPNYQIWWNRITYGYQMWRN